MKFPKKIFVALLLAVTLVGFAIAQKVEVTYMCWYNNTESEAQDNQAIIDKFNTSQDRIHGP